MKTVILKVVAITPMKNEIELVDLTGITYYWKLPAQIKAVDYSISEMYQVKGCMITKISSQDT